MAEKRAREKGPGDAGVRLKAASNFQSTVVVEAGAGTGKTSLLCDRVIHLIFRNPRPAAMSEIVALTFTRKAAGEMAERLRRILEDFIYWSEKEGPPVDLLHGGLYNRVRELYGRTTRQMGSLASRGLQELESAQITTIHGFAAHVLRLFCRQAHLDPAFREDDGSVFDEVFRRVWEGWLEEELILRGPREHHWRKALDGFGLETLRELAEMLGRGIFPLEELEESLENGDLFAAPPMLGEILAEGRALAGRLKGERKIEKQTRTAVDIIAEFVQGGRIEDLQKRLPELAGPKPGMVKGLAEEDYYRCLGIIEMAGRLASLDEEALAAALMVTLPAARRFRSEFIRSGHLSFDDLLTHLAHLLKRNLAVREILKGRYRHILVDEFQDTDPLQYEIILYLAEKKRQAASSWRDVEVEPGKLFIVGDPRQSIYGFRKADIQAYEEVLNKLGIRPERLKTNFRSSGELVGMINLLFRNIIRPEKGLQPPYLDLEPSRGGEGPSPAMAVRYVRPPAGRWRAREAAEAEATLLARWLSEELFEGKKRMVGPGGKSYRPGDVAILMRKMTAVGSYMGALREAGLPVLVEGERNFFHTQEIMQLVSLLRSLTDPGDDLALASVLRSPLGGLADSQLLLLGERSFDYRRVPPDNLKGVQNLGWLFDRLQEIHRVIGRLRISEVLMTVYRELPLMEIAVASSGEQGRANLLKVLDMARSLELSVNPSLETFIQRLEEGRKLEAEGESPLAETVGDAVRVMSIHQSKGLEFPVVIVPALHSAPGRSGGVVSFETDWSSGIRGLKVGNMYTPGAVWLSDRAGSYRQAEEKRLLYVAATRARDLLVFSAALDVGGPRGELLEFLRDGIRGLSGPGGGPVDGPIPGIVEISTEGWEKARAGRRYDEEEKPAFDAREISSNWERREGEYLAGFRHAAPSEAAVPAGKGGNREEARWMGRAVHRIMELIDFQDPAKDLEDLLEAAMDSLPAAMAPKRGELTVELERLIRSFLDSEAFQRLRRKRILGREIPVLTASGTASLEGYADLVMEDEGGLVVADFKTEEVEKGDVPVKAADYLPQGRIYVEALARFLGYPGGRLWVVFVRPGEIAEFEITAEDRRS
jgi:ATP-dependent helicase/nuclease subunit A